MAIIAIGCNELNNMCAISFRSLTDNFGEAPVGDDSVDIVIMLRVRTHKVNDVVHVGDDEVSVPEVSSVAHAGQHTHGEAQVSSLTHDGVSGSVADHDGLAGTHPQLGADVQGVVRVGLGDGVSVVSTQHNVNKLSQGQLGQELLSAFS